MNRVVVTGMGLITPIGNDIETFRQRMFAGESGVKNIRGSLVAENFPIPYAALVDADTIPRPDIIRELDPQGTSKFWLMSTAATEQALAGLPAKMGVDAIVYGTAEGVSFEVVYDSLELFKQQKDLEGFDWRQTITESSLDMLNHMLKARGAPELPAHKLIAINSACASGNQAIGVAFQRIRNGEFTRVLAGGVDARCNPSSLMNFHMLGAVTTADVAPETASRPFCNTRSGFVRGEGAATLLLESLDSALARGATIYGEVVGSSNTSDAYRLTDGREDGASVVYAMEAALRDAGIDKSKIDYINAHGTATQLNDRLETKSIKTVFGEQAYKIPVSSLKSQLGHPTVAAGTIEAIASFLMIEDQKLAPTINYMEQDPECDLDYVPNKARDAKVSHVLTNSFGFGGQNSCLVLKGYDK